MLVFYFSEQKQTFAVSWWKSWNAMCVGGRMLQMMLPDFTVIRWQTFWRAWLFNFFQVFLFWFFFPENRSGLAAKWVANVCAYWRVFFPPCITTCFSWSACQSCQRWASCILKKFLGLSFDKFRLAHYLFMLDLFSAYICKYANI